METTETAVVDAPVIDPSVEDAKVLGRIYSRLTDAVKGVKLAERTIKGAWIGTEDLTESRAGRFASLEKLVHIIYGNFGWLRLPFVFLTNLEL